MENRKTKGACILKRAFLTAEDGNQEKCTRYTFTGFYRRNIRARITYVEVYEISAIFASVESIHIII